MVERNETVFEVLDILIEGGSFWNKEGLKTVFFSMV